MFNNIPSPLSHDGHLAAGWLQTLAELAPSCGSAIDQSRLTYILIDLSEQPENIDYTRDLYLRLYDIKNDHRRNQFGEAWRARFLDDPKQACGLADRLWGPGGSQFPGVLLPAGNGNKFNSMP